MTSKKKLKREIRRLRDVLMSYESIFPYPNPRAEIGSVTTSTHKPGDPWQAVHVPPSPGPVVIHSPRFAPYVQEDDGA